MFIQESKENLRVDVNCNQLDWRFRTKGNNHFCFKKHSKLLLLVTVRCELQLCKLQLLQYSNHRFNQKTKVLDFSCKMAAAVRADDNCFVEMRELSEQCQNRTY